MENSLTCYMYLTVENDGKCGGDCTLSLSHNLSIVHDVMFEIDLTEEDFDPEGILDIADYLKTQDIKGCGTLVVRNDEKIMLSVILLHGFFGGLIMQVLCWEKDTNTDAMEYYWFVTDTGNSSMTEDVEPSEIKQTIRILN